MNTVATLSKVMRIGTMDTGRGRKASIFIKAEYRDGKLSISGVIGPLSSGNALGGCGQIDMEFAHRDPAQNDKRYQNLIKPSEINFAKGWTAEKWFNLLDVWKAWHLNDMRAECIHQRQRGETWATHPGAVCPDCGYKLGHAWLREEVPQGVIQFLEELPDADQQPAWV